MVCLVQGSVCERIMMVLLYILNTTYSIWQYAFQVAL